jgi:Sulfotransferase family
MDPARSPIFVVGNCRSGTTLLRMMLSAHPRIYITHEASFYGWAAVFPSRRPARAFLAYYFQTPEFRWLRLEPERVLEGLPDPLARERLPDAFVNVMRAKAAQYGRVRFGDKTPLNTRYLSRIFADFPDARVVHILRDPRTRAQSLCKMPWAAGNLFANTLTTEIDLHPVWRMRDRLLQIRMEDLLEDPRATMARVLEHAGEPWDDAVLEHVHHHPDHDDMPPVPWLERSKQGRSAPPDPTRGLTPAEVRMIEGVARLSMKHGPYAPAKLEREPSAASVLIECVRHVPSLFSFAWAYLCLARVTRDPRNFDSLLFRETFRRINPRAWDGYPGFEMPRLPPVPHLLTSGSGAAVEDDRASSRS